AGGGENLSFTGSAYPRRQQHPCAPWSPVMSCDAVAFAATLWLASTSAALPPPAAPAVASAPTSVAGEPLFADIVRRAGRLKAEAQAFETAPLDGELAHLGGFASFEAAIGELSALDMQGHVTLAQRGTDGDLKCILKGISQDLPVKLKALESAADAKSRQMALREMTYLLNDNVEVITAPPAPAA
ncbi:MAG: hypothetical protein ACHP84_14565, partial [Caulobacterales bacterium]